MQKYKVYRNSDFEIVTNNWQSYCAKHILIEAAGGFVQNPEGHLLMIYRNGKWDLPKGKLENDEDIKECAKREVEEECGVNNLKIVSELQSTYHTYDLNKESILKRTYWFKMTTDYSDKLVPQIKEGITEVKWVDKKDIVKKLAFTYSNIKELVFNHI